MDVDCAGAVCSSETRRFFMLGDLFQPMHLLIIGLVVVVFFGGKKLPELGKGLGEGLKGFKEGLKGVSDEVKNDAHIVTPEPKEPATKS
jgi:sec-independent protein translocase protein TatA